MMEQQVCLQSTTRNSVADLARSAPHSLDDPDGIDTKEAQYQWQRFVGGQWEDISYATSSTYKPLSQMLI